MEACNGLWRSEDVYRMDAYVARESLRDSVLQLGFLGKVEFLDLQGGTPQFSRPYAVDIRQCEEVMRKLAAIEVHLAKVPECYRAFSQDVHFCATLGEVKEEVSASAGRLDEAAETVETTLTALQALEASIQGVCNEFNARTEMSLLRDSITSTVRRAQRWGQASDSRGTSSTSLDGLADRRGAARGGGGDVGGAAWAGFNGTHGVSAVSGLESLPNVVGTITASRADAVSRLAFRTTRGHAVIAVDVVQNPQYAQPDWAEKQETMSVCTFAVFSFSDLAVRRLTNLLTGLGATIHNLHDVLVHIDDPVAAAVASTPPPPPPLSGSATVEAATVATDLRDTLASLHHQREMELRRWYPQHRRLKMLFNIEKQVAVTMGLCKDGGTTCTCALWVPARHEQQTRAALEVAADVSGSLARPILARVQPAPSDITPTYFMTNRFTVCFQGIVDSYGPARYKEVNPGVFTIVTFPYLFGIMYGDIGHGCLLLCLAAFLIYKERSWEGRPLNEMVAMVYGGRYVLLLMSLFAIYLGVLYNDFFGFSVNLFASGYTWPSVPNATQRGMDGYTDHVTPIAPDGRPSVRPPHVCAFGMDAAWAETDNKLEYYNSMKMKAAVIVGITHMLSGLCLAFLNAVRTSDYQRIWFLVMPETVFLVATFGYMSWLIVLKWCTRWENTHGAPSILETMTNFFLQPGVVPHPLFAGQAGLQVCLLLIAMAMVPLMLLGIPVCKYRAHKQRRSAQRERLLSAEAGLHSSAVRMDVDMGIGVDVDGDHEDASDGTAWRTSETTAAMGDHDETFDISEVAIHYVIHTIEYVLSSVSNTASYLRLWALSLAHAQLSEVFFNFAVVAVLDVDTTGVLIGVGVVVWLCATIGVLVGMEALSAFLHALRLHWVEFQSKFYAGDGRLFAPLSFEGL